MFGSFKQTLTLCVKIFSLVGIPVCTKDQKPVIYNGKEANQLIIKEILAEEKITQFSVLFFSFKYHWRSGV